jgi:hypothetical protein
MHANKWLWKLPLLLGEARSSSVGGGKGQTGDFTAAAAMAGDGVVCVRGEAWAALL